ncbi:5'-methylthioadenosine/S-adenosylhomocysteine nucleosidase family protein [Mycoplasma sp. 332]|uniref:5'-methylthioadenosine/S-adenosylhomocysteine nucleosidase family protein n=1 Tax=Mycoplasma sp. 332 TaxID=3458236 RepID=UPI004035A8AF
MKKISLFVVAEKGEIDILNNIFFLEDNLFENENTSLHLCLSNYSKKEFALLYCGVGKVNSSFGLTQSIAKLKEKDYQVEKIVNIGPAGCILDVNVGDAFIIENSYYFDVDLTKLPNYKLGQLPNNQYKFMTNSILSKEINSILGLKNTDLLSADKFFSKNDIEKIKDNFENIGILDMEACALIHCANLLGIRIAVIKVVSDFLHKNENFYITKKSVWKEKIFLIFKQLLEEL